MTCSANGPPARPSGFRLFGRTVEAGLRFAFYGRLSTEDYQDPVSSRRWQFDVATEAVAGRGRITAQYFDIGYSREIAWAERPEAARLLAAITDPDRGFDAIVVGEYAHAFYGSQATHLAPLLREYGVQLWLPEVDGPVDLDSPTHQALLLMLGAQSKLEVQRARFRTTAAMQAQARGQGRHLGGRPPYGYRIADAGPYPNRADAAYGRRLEPDPQTPPWVKWIFARRLEGHSIAGIARMLNEMGVSCPSKVDRKRNPHRPGIAWRQRTVAAIVANPRYTGRQVYLLVGLLRCGTCGRSMDPQSSHGNPAYRCSHGHTSAHTAVMRQARNLYLREDVIIGRIFAQMSTLTSRDAGIKEDIARLQQNRNTVELIAFLRAHNTMIECHAASVSLEPDQTKSIAVSTLTNAAEREGRIPRQRTQQQKQERGIV